jgi:dTDP-4-dehydrorhamnose reductase
MVRTAAFFGPWDAHNFVTRCLQAIARGEPWDAAHDQWVSPTYVPSLVHATLDLLVDGESGIWHLANRGAVTWASLASMAAEAARLDTRLVRPVPSASLGHIAPRPRFSALDSERGRVMPTLEDGIVSYISEATLFAPQAATNMERV